MTFVCHPDLSRFAFHLQPDLDQPAAFCTASSPVTSGEPPDQRKSRSRASSATISPDKTALTNGGCGAVLISYR
jgi:hypothetical protein